MAIQLHCTRSKIFVQSGSKTVKCARNETTSVPNWVKDTLGYQQGIADKSIIDLTPGSAATTVTDSAEVTALKARVAELEAQLARYENDATDDNEADENKLDPTSVVALSTAKSTEDTTGEAEDGVSGPKTGKPVAVSAAKGLQGGSKAKK